MENVSIANSPLNQEELKTNSPPPAPYLLTDHHVLRSHLILQDPEPITIDQLKVPAIFANERKPCSEIWLDRKDHRALAIELSENN